MENILDVKNLSVLLDTRENKAFWWITSAFRCARANA